MTLSIREIPGDNMAIIIPFIKQLNKDMEVSRIQQLLPVMLEKGYRCAGAFDGDTLVGVAGFWELCRFWCGPNIDIDNVVVDEARRGQQIGQKLVRWIEDWAKARGITFAVLDAYNNNYAAHKFYLREGYVLRGYHLTKDL